MATSYTFNNTQVMTPSDIPPLPSYTTTPAPPLIPPIPDKYMSLILPIIAYWVVSMIFHYIDTYDYFSKYRLHTPAEVLKRNHVSRWEVVRDVVVQQIVQTGVGIVLALGEPDPVLGKDEYNIAVWAQRIRFTQRGVPVILSLLGVNANALAQKAFAYSPSLAGMIAGGSYPWAIEKVNQIAIPAFATWETFAAQMIYWYGIPTLQFVFAIIYVDTWQYFLHRAMHINKWLYTTFHSRHHRLYVPYAYGALYNHPFEGFLLDSCGAGLAYLICGMTPRQAMWFFTCSTIKTVDDHCGYALPWDPLQHLTSNNAGYHDVHHQSWGIKTNFSQPFFTFWDRALGTVWTGGDVSARYERAKIAAQKKMDIKTNNAKPRSPTDSVLNSVSPGKAASQAVDSQRQILEDPAGGGVSVLLEETAEEEKEIRRINRAAAPRTKKSTSSASTQAGSLKGLRDRVSSGSGGFHGRTGGVLGYDRGR